MPNLALRPIHYASVSGGKDSLYMLKIIFENPDKYPLDMVVHFELEIDWEWVKPAIDKMEQMCKAAGIPFVRLKPRTSWYEFYEKWGLPSIKARWCNLYYKLDCKKQLNKWCKSQNCRPIAYIGFCADEQQRFQYTIGDDWELGDACYPLAEEGINESFVLEWAKNNPIFGDWYKHFKRQGCMFCPMISRKELAYMYLNYPERYEWFTGLIRERERERGKPYFNDPIDIIDRRVKTKYAEMLKDEDRFEQIKLFS